MIAKLATIAEIRKEIADNHFAGLKYVRVKNEYRFLFVNEYCAAHEQMIDDGEWVQSAAYVKVYRDRVEVEGSSMSLRKYPHSSDEENIRKLILETNQCQ